MEFENRFVAFIDILGFKNILKAENDSLVEDYYSSLMNLRGQQESASIDKFILGDAIVLSNQYNDDVDHRLNSFRDLIKAVSRIQFTLANKNIWTRGGISFGKIYLDKENNFLTGKPLVKAFEIERDSARFPRVVVDTKVLSLFGDQTNVGSFVKLVNPPSENRFDNCLLFDWRAKGIENVIDGLEKNTPFIVKDVPLFVDYLASTSTNQDVLKRLIGFIEKRTHDDIAYYEKYRWVANYLLSGLYSPLGHEEERIRLHNI